MNMHRALRVPARRMLFVAATLCALLAITGKSVWAHGEDIAEPSPLQSNASSPSSPSHLSSPKAAGLQASCWALSIPYGAGKIVYAMGGGIVGGLAWAMTGGNVEAAKSVWIPSMTGDYTIQPQHLTGEKHLYFVGASSESRQP